MNFNLGNKFCDTEELENLCHNTNILDTIVSYFAELYNMSRPDLLKDIKSHEADGPDGTFDENESNQSSSSDKQRKKVLLKSIKTIINTAARKIAPFLLINSLQIYERWNSKRLITSFNRSA